MDSVSVTQCFKGEFGKHLSYCKYGFPFKVPQLTEELDEDNVHYIYVRRQHEDRMVVSYNPEIALLWGASHNVQRVGLEQYLASTSARLSPPVTFSCQRMPPSEVSAYTCCGDY